MRETDFSNDDTWPPRGIVDVYEEGPDVDSGRNDADRPPQRPDDFVIRLPGRYEEL
jgi:hypothetical protein